MGSGSIPIWHRLWMQADDDTKLLSQPVQDISGYPEVISSGGSYAGTNLELPLGRHDLCIGSADRDPSVKATSVVGLNQIPGEHLVCSDPAIVRSGNRQTISIRPAKWTLVEVQ